MTPGRVPTTAPTPIPATGQDEGLVDEEETQSEEDDEEEGDGSEFDPDKERLGAFTTLQSFLSTPQPVLRVSATWSMLVVSQTMKLRTGIKRYIPISLLTIHGSDTSGQDEDQQAFTPLTDTANRAVYTHGLSYTPTLPEYPKSDHDGFTYVIPVPPEKRGLQVSKDRPTVNWRVSDRKIANGG